MSYTMHLAENQRINAKDHKFWRVHLLSKPAIYDFTRRHMIE